MNLENIILQKSNKGIMIKLLCNLNPMLLLFFWGGISLYVYVCSSLTLVKYLIPFENLRNTVKQRIDINLPFVYTPTSYCNAIL